MNNQQTKRFDFLDIAKALTMLFVIWGHAASGTSDPLYRMIFYAFTMPLILDNSGKRIYCNYYTSESVS